MSDPPPEPAAIEDANKISARWQPRRCGLVNLFYYDDQPFHFEDGHLLVRGRNGAGKSRVLALTLPFLLDGEARPARVEPDGDAAKRVEWHLLMSDHEERTGYTWIEFERPAPDPRGRGGVTERCTLAVGLHARRGRSGPPRTWFVVTSRRVGPGPDELPLIRGGFPATRQELKDLPGVDYFESAGDYRDAIDRRLFGLGRERYAALLDLLIELRKPQLAKNFDEAALSATLSQSLPPMPAAVLDIAARAFEGLEQQKNDLANLNEARRSLAVFFKTYRRYARIAARRFAQPVRKTHSEYESAREQFRRTETQAAEAATALARHRDEEASVTREQETVAGQIRTYEADPARRDAARLGELSRMAADAHGRFKRQERHAEDAKKQLALRTADTEQAHATWEARVNRSDERARAAASAADRVGLQDAHANVATVLGPEPDRDRAPAALDRLDGIVSARRDAAHRLQQFDHKRTAAETEADRRAALQAEQQTRREEAQQAARDNDDRAHQAATQLQSAYRTWADGLHELRLDPAALFDHTERFCAARLGAAAEGTEADAGPIAVVSPAAQLARRQLANARADTARRLADLDEARQTLEAERNALKQGRHEPPDAPHTRDPDRPRRPGPPGRPALAARGFSTGLSRSPTRWPRSRPGVRRPARRLGQARRHLG